MTVLLVDDNRLMLEGLQNLLEAHQVQVVGVASDGLQGLNLARSLKPDVILMDIRMPGCNGLAAARLIKAEMPDTKIIMLTTSDDDDDLFEAVKAGACGYLLKSINAETLIEALAQAREGIPPFSPGLANRILKEFANLSSQGAPAPAASDSKKSGDDIRKPLNSRQIEVLTLVARGLAYKEVGALLNISPHTVRYHMVEIMDQLHIENRAQVLAYAGQLGLGRDSKTT